MSSAQFELERFASIEREVGPLFRKHYLEISSNQDIELAPDLDLYRELCDRGIMKCFTARDLEDNELIGYAFFFVKHNLHYQHSLQAVQDIIFIDKSRRGFGSEFISWCDEQLKAMGVQVVYHHVKAAHNWGPVLERKGYKMIEYIYSKRLDLEG